MARVWFNLFTATSLSICVLAIVYHSRFFSLSDWLRRDDPGREVDEREDEQQRYNRPFYSPHRWFVYYLGVFFLVYRLLPRNHADVRSRVFGVINLEVKPDFILDFVPLWSAHSLHDPLGGDEGARIPPD
ncbi:hypothetical protein M3Y99_01812900 [Aphelenchoides fujianensis]|nr:hypothetical protein M3Y99_01812900 [Aphelenchoides fujianensis]